MDASPKNKKEIYIACGTVVGIAVHLLLRFVIPGGIVWAEHPLWAVLLLGGGPLTFELIRKALHGQFGSDLLAGISIVTSVFLGEYLAGSLVVLMLSGGEALESYAVHSASSVLAALARRMPSVAHLRVGNELREVDVRDVKVGDIIDVLPHEISPVDGIVIRGHGVMNEAYLTGEPFEVRKAPGAEVISGAVNGENLLTVRALREASDSRYAKIMRVMEQSEQSRPRIRRLGDSLGAFYTPLAVGIALLAWILSDDPIRFLSVVVVATPCPLLIAIPVAIIGAISLAAKRGIIIKDPTILEQIDRCRAIVFDKTGTLTYGKPVLTEMVPVEGMSSEELLRLSATIEQYSKHPLALALVEAAQRRNLQLGVPTEISERPGEGLTGVVDGKGILITGRQRMADAPLPPAASGLECIVVVDGRYAGLFRFRDAPRTDSRSFIEHLSPKHRLERIALLSGDRESEVRYLAEQVGITEVYAERSPEEKLEIVAGICDRYKTIYVGDGINDAPALMRATVGIAMGQNSEITSDAAGAVILEPSLTRVDELFHIGRRMRSIALQSAIGGMAASLLAMWVAALGYLPPVMGAVTQELIDLVAVINALRVSARPSALTDFKR